MPVLLPVMTLQLQMQGLATLGLDMQRIAAQVGPLPAAPDALVPLQTYLNMWSAAETAYGMPGLPTAMAMAIPFGAFGALDYLAGSASTVAGMSESVQLHFSMVTNDIWIEYEILADGNHALRVRGEQGTPVQVLEFTLAVFASRVRTLSALGGDDIHLLRVGLPISKPAEDPVRERLWGAALEYDFPCAEIVIDHACWQRDNPKADPFLHATLKRLADQLELDQHAQYASIEQALRMRLRGALAQGPADLGRMAVLMGISERTLQRRLREIGRSFSEVLESFRRDESAHLLCDPSVELVDIANRLGYAEQTSFTRAFKRWAGTTPGVWRANRAKPRAV